MATTNIYLNFTDQAEAAFTFYRSIFGGEFEGGISRMGDMPQGEGMPPVSDAEKDLVLHVQLPILGGTMLMGSDVPKSMGTVVPGNSVSISLHPDSREEADRLFAALSEGGSVEMPMADAFWGDYFGSCVDKFGIHWMVNYSKEQ